MFGSEVMCSKKIFFRGSVIESTTIPITLIPTVIGDWPDVCVQRKLVFGLGIYVLT